MNGKKYFWASDRGERLFLKSFDNESSILFGPPPGIPGNHEYYGSDIKDKPDPLWENIRHNVHLVNNRAIIHDGIRLVFSTLWSRISPDIEWDIQRSIADFSAITYAGERLTPRIFNFLHEESLAFLKSAISSGGDIPTVVVTHHVPTLMHYPPVYKQSRLTEAFAVELFGLIEHAGAANWIYGHHHEHGSFQRGAVVEV